MHERRKGNSKVICHDGEEYAIIAHPETSCQFPRASLRLTSSPGVSRVSNSITDPAPFCAMLERFRQSVRRKIEERKTARDQRRRINTARESLDRVAHIRDEDSEQALALLDQVFETLGCPDISQELWNEAYSEVCELVRTYSLATKTGIPDAIQDQLTRAVGLLVNRRDEKHDESIVHYQHGVLHLVAIHVGLAENSAGRDDLASCLSECEKAFEGFSRPCMEPLDRRTEQLTHNVVIRLANLYLWIGDTLANRGSTEDAISDYRLVHSVLQPCVQDPCVQDEIRSLWNKAIHRQNAPPLRRLDEGQSDESIRDDCEVILENFAAWIGPLPPKNPRSRVVDCLIDACSRLADNSFESREDHQAAEHYLQALEHLQEADQDRRLLSIDRIAQSVPLDSWEHSKCYRRHAGLKATKKKPIFDRWLAHCDALISEIGSTSPDDDRPQPLVAHAEQLLHNCGCIFGSVKGAKKRIGYRQLCFLVAAGSDVSSAVNSARGLLKPFGLRTATEQPRLTLRIWQVALDLFMEHDPEFLKGDRVFGLVDLLEKHLAPAPSPELNDMKRTVYSRLLRYDDYVNIEYEKHHGGLFGVFRASSLSAPLDYFFCLQMAMEMVARPEDMPRVQDLSRICAKRFETETTPEAEALFHEAYFRLVEGVTSTDQQRFFLRLVKDNNYSEKTRIRACDWLSEIRKTIAERSVEEQQYEMALEGLRRALRDVDDGIAESSRGERRERKSERLAVIDRMISVCREASASHRSDDAERANEFLVEALQYLRQSGEFSGKNLDKERTAILKEFLVDAGGSARPSKMDAEFCFQWARNELKSRDVDADSVAHFLHLAFLGEALDEATFNYHLGRCHLSIANLASAEQCFQRALSSLESQGTKRTDSKKLTARSLERLAAIARREAEDMPDADTDSRREKTDVEVDCLRRAIATETALPSHHDLLIEALRRRAELSIDDPQAGNQDLAEALKVLDRRVELAQGDSQLRETLNETRGSLLMALSTDHLEVVALTKTDARLCREMASGHISRRGKIGTIEHLLRLAQHGRALDEAGYHLELGEAHRLKGNMDVARGCYEAVKDDADEGVKKTILAKAYQGLGKIDYLASIASSTSSGQEALDEPERLLNQAISSLSNAQGMASSPSIHDDLGACYRELARTRRLTPRGISQGAVRGCIVCHNEDLRKSFMHYDKAHRADPNEERKENLGRLGGGLGYLMLAAMARRTGREKAIKRHLERCEAVFPDAAAAKLAIMIRQRAYPGTIVGIEATSEHDLAFGHYLLATKCCQSGLHPHAEFLLGEALHWHEQFPSLDVDMQTVKADLLATKELLDATEESGHVVTAFEEPEPSAKDLGWERFGTLQGNFLDLVSATKDLLNEVGPLAPGSLRIAVHGLDYVLKTYYGGTKDEAAQAETELGSTLKEQLFPEAKLCDADSSLSKIARDVTLAAANLAESKLKFTLWIEKLDEVNAFALPGGFIVISRELVETCGGEADELAFVIGHEAAHILRHHYIARSALGNVRKLIAKYGRETILRLLSKGFAQDQELEADRLGVQYAQLANYAPEGAIAFLNRFKQQGSPVLSLDRFFQNHPPYETRIKELRRITG